MTAARRTRLVLPRYIGVGAACAALNILLMMVLDVLGFGYLSATFIAFVPVLVFGYALHATCTFQAPVSWRSFGRYTLAMLTNYPFWLASMYVLVERCGLRIALAAPITALTIFAWNYLVSSLALDPAFQPFFAARQRDR